MKRARTSKPPGEPPRKSSRTTPTRQLTATSIREQARPYLLATATLPLSVLCSSWRVGYNRPSDLSHIHQLRNAFETGGVRRDSYEDYLLVSCSAAAVNRLRDHAKTTRAVTSTGEQALSFENWSAVVRDERPELIAGQHRVAALQSLAASRKLDEAELWWTCELYDRDTLPIELSTKLRANRRELMLPDSHGQIWMQLETAYQQDRRLFQGKKERVQQQMIDVLHLAGTPQFPLARLVTLWQNDRWHPATTRVCETAVGRDLFNISTWEWMASCRIDEYWFATLEQVVQTLSRLPGGRHVRLADWNRLVALSKQGQRGADVEALFYPPARREAGLSAEQPERSRRRPGFLDMLGDNDFMALCRYIRREAPMFPDVHGLLQTGKGQGRLMIQTLTHVILWVEPEPTALHDRRRTNKPLLREDLKPSLRRLSPSLDEQGVDELSITIERTVLDFARQRIDELRGPAARALDVMPEDGGAVYAQRFALPFWRDLLHAVQGYLGPVFRLPWELPSPQPAQAGLSTLTEQLVSAIRDMPEVSSNLALQRADAVEALSHMVGEAVQHWAASVGQDAAPGHVDSQQGDPGPDRAVAERVDVVQSAKVGTGQESDVADKVDGLISEADTVEEISTGAVSTGTPVSYEGPSRSSQSRVRPSDPRKPLPRGRAPPLWRSRPVATSSR